jgi:hypothetical protein
LSGAAIAQWSGNPTVNNAICNASGDQILPVIASDGFGGWIIAWQDFRFGDYDIFAQRITANGTVQWAAGGVDICTASGTQRFPRIVYDGYSGAVITWEDRRSGTNYDIYAQSIDETGAVQWTADGVAISTAAGDQVSPNLINHELSGGATTITWVDYRGGTTSDIYAQAINYVGVIMMTANGVAISTANGDQYNPGIVEGGEIGSKGSIITWTDKRGGEADIYAQRISQFGDLRWTANGIAIAHTLGDEFSPAIVSDGGGGAIITWQVGPGLSGYDIYAGRINSLGQLQWSTPVSTAISHQMGPIIVSDSSGGAIIAWSDTRSQGDPRNIYAQSVGADATKRWAEDGLAICTASGYQFLNGIVSDGAGGAIIAWYDYRSGTSYDVYAQRISQHGWGWTANGVATSTASGDQENSAVVSDGSGGAIITWQDSRGGYQTWDIYASHVNQSGLLPVQRDSFIETPQEFSLKQNYPNPFNPLTTIKYSIPISEFITLKVYDVLGNEVATLVDEYRHAGNYEVEFVAPQLSSGVYLYKLQSGDFIEVKKMILLQ